MGVTTLHIDPLVKEKQDKEISQAVKTERKRLFRFINKRVNDQQEAEDILQDVFYQLVETYRIMKPVEQMTSWLFRVARNKITDNYRKKKTVRLEEKRINEENENEPLFLSDLISSGEITAEEKMMNELIMEQVSVVLEELPEEQREVFLMHELEERSFKEIAEITNESVNTLLSRKRYAVMYLREKLGGIYNEMFTN